MKQHKFTKPNGIGAVAWLSSVIAGLDDKKKYVVEVKEDREKRSLDANAYCWVLIDKLAAVTHKTLKQDKEKVMEQIYKNAVKDIGGNSEVVCVKTDSVDKICEVWEKKGLGWQTERFPSKIEGCTNIILYYGSSVYDTKQMSRLIDNIVQDCKAQDIETMTPAELEALKGAWCNA